MTNRHSPSPACNKLARTSLILGIISLSALSLITFLPGPGPSGPGLGVCFLLVILVLVPINFILSLMALLRRGQKLAALTGLLATAFCIPLFFYYSSLDPTPRVTALRTSATKSHLVVIKISLIAFHADVGRYPTTIEGLVALLAAPSGTDAQWHGPYIDKTMRWYSSADIAWDSDAWMRPLIYKSPGTTHPDTFDLFSAGRDGQPNTADDITP
jgi:general secretion pathway protein G